MVLADRSARSARARGWRAALGVCFANALPEGDPEGVRALAEAVTLGGSPDDIVAASEVGDALLTLNVASPMSLASDVHRDA